ncbi:MAG: immR [Firmicutes bacterium]|nr:immR [Bacillota bacterium]
MLIIIRGLLFPVNIYEGKLSMNFSTRLKQLRQIYNISQKTLSDLLGISPRAFRFYESGEHEPTLKNLTSLANYFGVSLDYLTGRNDDPRYEEFVEKAETIFINELDTLKVHEKNATFMSLEESLGAIGKGGLTHYEGLRRNYSSPIARLKLIFAERENINKKIEHAQKVARYCKLPEDGPISYIRNKFRANELVFMRPLKAGEKNPDQLLIEELDKLEAEYKTNK